MFRVEWLQSALDELAAAWTNADPALRQAITAASHEIDVQLQHNAPNLGESRPGGRRLEFFPPLAVTYRVEADGQTVTILRVRVFQKRRR